MNSAARRARFDAIVAEVIAALPPAFMDFIDEVPVIVLDEPPPEMLRELAAEFGEPVGPEDLCGLHTGVADTEASVEESAVLPSQIHLFRRGIVSAAGGWAEGGEAGIREQVRITLLHEIGHQLGLDEDDLEELGYG